MHADEQADPVARQDTTCLGRAVSDAERLRLLAWVAAPERLTYLHIIDAFAAAHANYAVQLRPQDLLDSGNTATGTDELDDKQNGLEHDALVRHLDSLASWGVLDRAWDSALVTSIEQYRRRRPVYRLSELGERAYRGVRDLLDARPGEGRLQGFVLRSIADDLQSLNTAVRNNDGDEALLLLNRVDIVLRQLADRAAQFYVLVESLSQEADVKAERFIELKDLLLTHLYGFLDELGRWSPVIAGHIRLINQAGVDTVLDMVTAADEAVFLTKEQQRAEWQARWEGLVSWFAAVGRPSRVADLDRRTTTAVRELTSLLRRLMEVRGRGASRATDMVELARWFWALNEEPDGTDGAHALFAAMFGLAGARHLARSSDEFGDVAPSVSWHEAPRVEVPSTLRTRGRTPSPGASARVPDDGAIKGHFRRLRIDELERQTTAVAKLSTEGLGDRVLSVSEFDVLMRLVDTTLIEGVPSKGSIATATEGHLIVRLSASDGDTVVNVDSGQMTMQGVAIELVSK